MQVKVTKEFKFSPDGNRTVDVKVGQLVQGRCAEVALQEKWGVAVTEKQAPAAGVRGETGSESAPSSSAAGAPVSGESTAPETPPEPAKAPPEPAKAPKTRKAK